MDVTSLRESCDVESEALGNGHPVVDGIQPVAEKRFAGVISVASQSNAEGRSSRKSIIRTPRRKEDVGGPDINLRSDMYYGGKMLAPKIEA